VIEGIQDLGLCSRGSGADNIRNVTGTPTAGIDPQELIDTRPYAREWHFHILNDRSLYGLPRKFNVAFDGAGIIPVLEDTNDIGFQAVEVKDGFGVEPGVWFRLALGGITGHKDFARDTGVIVKPRRRDQSRRRHRARVHRSRRPHQPQQGAAEIRARRWGFDKFLGAGRGEARPEASRACRRSAVRRARPSTAWRISACTAEAGRAELDRRRRCRSAR
jgi:ferredoxin-nitrite reductase